MTGLTHFDAEGRAVMVDVGAKPVTARAATARARVVMQPATLAMIRAGTAKKGDVLGVARLAGIMAAKRTADLIPLCHPLPISAVTVDLEPTGEDSVEIAATEAAVSASISTPVWPVVRTVAKISTLSSPEGSRSTVTALIGSG